MTTTRTVPARRASIGQGPDLSSTAAPPPAAFFDVDETVVAVKTMFHFLRYHLMLAGDDGSAYEAIREPLSSLAAAGVDRTEVNRMYYRSYAGARLDVLRAEGRAWFADLSDRPGAFVPAVLDAVRDHKARGHLVGLVSGSFRVCVEPLAEWLDADFVVCTEPVLTPAGVLTGEVERPMIGAEKARAVRGLISRHGLDRDRCYGYADHASDLELLRSVGLPRVVGPDPVLAEHAERHGWPVLPLSGPTEGPCHCGGAVARWSMPDQMAESWACPCTGKVDPWQP